MFGLSFAEVIVIALIAILLFGKEDLPQNLRKFAKWFGEFKKTTTDIQHSWLQVKDEVSRKIMNEVHEVEGQVKELEQKSTPPPQAVAAAAGEDVAPVVSFAEKNVVPLGEQQVAEGFSSDSEVVIAEFDGHHQRRAVQSAEIGTPPAGAAKEKT